MRSGKLLLVCLALLLASAVAQECPTLAGFLLDNEDYAFLATGVPDDIEAGPFTLLLPVLDSTNASALEEGNPEAENFVQQLLVYEAYGSTSELESARRVYSVANATIDFVRDPAGNLVAQFANGLDGIVIPVAIPLGEGVVYLVNPIASEQETGEGNMSPDESDDIGTPDWCIPSVSKCSECTCAWKCDSKHPRTEMCYVKGKFVKCKKFPCLDPNPLPPWLTGGGSGSSTVTVKNNKPSKTTTTTSTKKP